MCKNTNNSLYNWEFLVLIADRGLYKFQCACFQSELQNSLIYHAKVFQRETRHCSFVCAANKGSETTMRIERLRGLEKRVCFVGALYFAIQGTYIIGVALTAKMAPPPKFVFECEEQYSVL